MSIGIFKRLHHICIVVENLDRAVEYYESIGIGPWLAYPPLDAYRNELDVPDRDGFFSLEYRYANLDNVQLQLCCPGRYAAAAVSGNAGGGRLPSRFRRRRL